MHKLKCLRCDVPMEFVKRENVQLGKTGFLTGDWGNLFAGALYVAIFTCPKCAKLEFFRGGYYEEQEPEEMGIAKTTCPNCGTQHDLDYPKCPRCDTPNPKW